MRTATELVFPFQHAGALVSAVQQYGPANASRAADIVTGSGLRRSYLDLARYLDRFGPCQKKLAGEPQGWWSSYGQPPGDSIWHPPYRLDAPPVKTVWIKSDVLYALADTALRLKLQTRLRQRSGSGRVQRGCQEAAALLEQETPNREGVALSLAQLLLRHYLALHEAHLDLKTNPR